MFSTVIRRASRRHRVHIAVLGEFRFVGGTMFLHNEGGVLRSRGFDGEIEAINWKGMQGLARVSGLGASKIGQSRQVTCSLKAESQTLKDYFFGEDQRQVRGRKFVFWGQFYDDDLMPLDPRFHIYTGIGDKLRMIKSGPKTREITLLLEDRLVRRRRSANAMVTHDDQQLRDPGSTGFIYVQKMLDQSLNLFDAR
ncbi:hypothetical protein [Rhizobium sp. Leaf386]|uniref:hypothetical protein n=1 Tax=Rhizobium sp. Leaf386 TaxID=1736359 RepID=UPI000713CF33|nr:hypothetical protein [Rhizobium sp. Leaf386]KQS90297.1 hypothetical protein ASG50_07520 [Rhizobium sp. Leaf386]